MASEIKDSVKEYYGKILHTNEDLKTNACVQVGKVPKQVRDALDLCHEEVLSKYYGCGLVFPTAVEGVKVLDFGSGSGRDCYILSKLVGENGFVTGVDMTQEQVDVARKYIAYHTEKFGYSKPNVDFKLGYIENLKESGVEDESIDLIISNCVINLSPDKPSVFKEAFRVLKEGGEFYFSDIYADRELPQNIKEHKELWGECLAGALYWKSFVDTTKEIGFSGPYLVTSQNMTCGNEELQKVLDPKLGIYFLVCTSPQTHVQNKSGERISPGRLYVSNHEVYTLNGLFVYCCSGHDNDVIRNGRTDDMGDILKTILNCTAHETRSENGVTNTVLILTGGDSKFVSATYRLFKTSKKPDEKCCCCVKYKGTMKESPESFKFDHKQAFDSNFKAVSSDIVNVLKNSRYSQHLEFKDSENAPCASANYADPFELANACTDKSSCCN